MEVFNLLNDKMFEPVAIVQTIQQGERKEEQDPIVDTLNRNATDRISESSFDIIVEGCSKFFNVSKNIPADIFRECKFPVKDMEFLGRDDDIKKRVVVFTEATKNQYSEIHDETVVGIVICFSVNDDHPWRYIVPIYADEDDEYVTISNDCFYYIGESFMYEKELPADIKSSIYDYLRCWYTVQEAMKHPVAKSWLKEHSKELGLKGYNVDTERAFVDGKEKYVYAKDDLPKAPRAKKMDEETRDYVRKTRAWARVAHERKLKDGTVIWVGEAVCGPEREAIIKGEKKIETRERHVPLNPEYFDVDQKAIIEGNNKEEK